MAAERVWDAIWLTVFLTVQVGLVAMLLPSVPAVQLVVVPAWIGYWLLTRGPRLGAWVALWGGILLEWAWGTPAGACVVFFLLLWRVVRLFHNRLPREVSPLHGLLGGVVLAPVLRLWLWFYSVLWLGPLATEGLVPGLTAVFVMPAAGALGGGMVFALARLCEFRVLMPPREEVHGDEG